MGRGGRPAPDPDGSMDLDCRWLPGPVALTKAPLAASALHSRALPALFITATNYPQTFGVSLHLRSLADGRAKPWLLGPGKGKEGRTS